MLLDLREVRCIWPSTAASTEAVTDGSSASRLTTCKGNSAASADAKTRDDGDF